MEVDLPKDNAILRAVCDPPFSSKSRWMYHYDWDIDEGDKHPPELKPDSRKPDFVEVSRLTEGVHNISVNVTRTKRSDTECGNLDGNSKSVVRYGIGKITVKSGN